MLPRDKSLNIHAVLRRTTYYRPGTNKTEINEACHGVVERYSKFPPEYRVENQKLFQKYYPLETDVHLSHEEKYKYCSEWWGQVCGCVLAHPDCRLSLYVRKRGQCFLLPHSVLPWQLGFSRMCCDCFGPPARSPCSAFSHVSESARPPLLFRSLVCDAHANTAGARASHEAGLWQARH